LHKEPACWGNAVNAIHTTDPDLHIDKEIDMKKTSQFAFALIAAALAGPMAFAGQQDPGHQHTISWDDFKYRCSDSPDKPLNEQGVPTHIKVICTNVEREFVADKAGAIPLDASRHVAAHVTSDKFDVSDAMERDYPVAAKGAGMCPRYKEVEHQLQVERDLSCADVLSIKGDVQDYCAANVDSMKGAVAKNIQTHDTGVVINTCGGSFDTGKK
jgi:hypothetical protein